MRSRGKAAAIAVVAAVFVLAGCESPLKLEGVAARQAQAVRRADVFQAAADNGHTIVVVGSNGLVIHSGDRGASWQRRQLGAPGAWPSFIDVTACPDGRFAALAYEKGVWTSADGAAWQRHGLNTEEAPQAITCDPRNRIWVVGSFSTVLDSSDGGASWQDHSTGEDTIFTGVQFVDATHGVIVGEFGTVLTSADGGASWAPAGSIPGEFYPQSGWFRSASEGWVVGLGGRIYHTTDGGASWQQEPSGTLVTIYGIQPVGGRLYAVGGEGSVLERGDDARWRAVEHGRPILLWLRARLAVGGDRLLVGGRQGALYVLPLGDLERARPVRGDAS